MGVYIKGVKAPLRCSVCTFCRKDDSLKVYCENNPSEYYCRLLQKKIRLDVRRPIDCPIVDVPAHGDLIDADVLLNHLVPGGGAAICVRIADVVIPEDREDTL